MYILAKEIEEHFDNNEERIVAQEPEVGLVGISARFVSTSCGICDVPELRKESMEATILFTDVIVAPSSIVIPSHGVTTSMKSTTLSFAWTLVDQRMILRDDGLYHDLG